MSLDATLWALPIELPTAQKVVLLSLAIRQNHLTGRCDPAMETLIRDTGLGRTALCSALAGLEKRALIERRKRTRGGLRMSNAYSLLIGKTDVRLAEVSSSPGEQRSSSGESKQFTSRTQIRNVNQEIETEAQSAPDEKKKAIAFQPPEWIDREAWDGFVEMRRRIRKPLTQRACKAIVDKLGEFRSQGVDPNRCLDASTENAWSSVYPPKNPPPRSSAGSAPPPPDEDAFERKRQAQIAAFEQEQRMLAQSQPQAGEVG